MSLSPHEPDPDRSRLEALVEQMLDEPSSFADVRDLASRSAFSTSKLGELFRRHYHTTPLEMLTKSRIDEACRKLHETRKPITEICFDVGYETISVFNSRFRARNGLSPQGYRRLLGADSFTLDLPSWFPLERVMKYLGRDPKSPLQQVEGHLFRFAAAQNGAAAVASVELDRKKARCTLEVFPGRAGEAPAQDWGTFVHRRLLRLLGLVIDPQPFERRIERSKELRPLIEGRRGLTIPQTHDLIDALVWVIVGQQVSLPVAFRLRNRLTERYGRSVSGRFAVLPTLDTVANLGYDDLKAIGFSLRKAEYLIDVARQVVDGKFDLEALERSSATAIEHRLLALRGFGPWSAHYLMMRAMGLRDCVPVGDVALARSLGEFFELEKRPEKDGVLELMKPFAPYRSLATFHLWSRLGDAQ